MTKPTDQYVPSVELPPPLSSDSEVLGWVEQCVQDAESARLALQIAVPGVQSRAVTVHDMRQAERVYLVRLGAALGAAVTAYRLNKISSVAYNAFVGRAQGTTVLTRSKTPIAI